MITNRKQAKNIRHVRIRAKIAGTSTIPRVAVFRSNKYLSAQVIDDQARTTLFGIKATTKNCSAAKQLGTELAKKLIAKGIKVLVFDRGGYRYHGAVKAIAEALREGGLQF